MPVIFSDIYGLYFSTHGILPLSNQELFMYFNGFQKILDLPQSKSSGDFYITQVLNAHVGPYQARLFGTLQLCGRFAMPIGALLLSPFSPEDLPRAGIIAVLVFAFIGGILSKTDQYEAGTMELLIYSLLLGNFSKNLQRLFLRRNHIW